MVTVIPSLPGSEWSMLHRHRRWGMFFVLGVHSISVGGLLLEYMRSPLGEEFLRRASGVIIWRIMSVRQMVAERRRRSNEQFLHRSSSASMQSSRTGGLSNIR